MIRGDPDHVGDLAEAIERGEAGVVQTDAVDDDQALATADDGHVAAEPDRQRAGQADRPGDEEQVGQDLDELAVRIGRRMGTRHVRDSNARSGRWMPREPARRGSAAEAGCTSLSDLGVTPSA